MPRSAAHRNYSFFTIHYSFFIISKKRGGERPPPRFVIEYIYMERSFNAAHFIQSKDRIHRYGLKPGTETNYYYLLSEDSVDQVIHDRLIAKETRLREIIESMPIPLYDNAELETGDEDITALIAEYVNRTKKMEFYRKY